LIHFLRANEEKIASLGTGSTFKAITIKTLKSIEIPLPNLETQKRIAAILDEADTLRQLNQQLIGKYDALTQSLFLDMFGDPVTNPKGWEKMRMDKLMKIVRGGSPRPIDKFLGGTYPWIKIGDATRGNDIYLDETKEHIIEEGLKKTRLLPKGSLIFANCGVSLGFARIITFEGCIHDGWLAFSEYDEEKINKIFLLKALNSITKYFRETAPEGTQPNLNIGIISGFEIILPSISLQNKFEDSLFLIEQQKQQAQEALQKSEQLFNGLLQKAFNGTL
jgi:type I restriction enzyme S subunit